MGRQLLAAVFMAGFAIIFMIAQQLSGIEFRVGPISLALALAAGIGAGLGNWVFTKFFGPIEK